MKKETAPNCRECVCMELTGLAISNGNNSGNPRRGCRCRHPKAKEIFKIVCPRSPREPAFIGFTSMGGNEPQIKTSPRWCPLRHLDLLKGGK